jgi:RNA-directed DNA polymerase
MKVSYDEGLATHIGPESCAGAGNRAGEALTGGRAGWALSREIHDPQQRELRGADVLEDDGRPHRERRDGKTRTDLARSETPGMYGCTLCGNREIPPLSESRGLADRIGNPTGARR